MPGTYRTLSVHVEPDPDEVEVRELRGEKYLVAPVVAVAEGVLNGGFLPFEEIAASAPGWNGAPVTVNHPEDDNGDFVPANIPEVLEEYQIGRFLDVEAVEEGKKLTGNLWVNLGDVKYLAENSEERGDLAKQVVEKLREGDPLEVSTGYWHQQVEDPGEFEGQSYEKVQVDLLPDHLATLPASEGACNWEGDSTASGCGAPRANAGDVDADGAGPRAVQGSASAGDALAFAANALRNAAGLGDPTDEQTDRDADRLESYALHGRNCDCGDHQNMGDNDDRLEALAESTEFDVDELREMDEQTVEKLADSLDANDDPDGDADGSANAGDSTDDGDAPEWAQNLVDRVEDRVDELEDRLDAQEQERVDELVETITSQTKFDEDDLEALGIAEDSDALETFAEKQGATIATDPDFGGRAAGAGNADDGAGDYEPTSVVNEVRDGDTAAAAGGD